MLKSPHSRGAQTVAALFAKRMQSLRVQSERVGRTADMHAVTDPQKITLSLPAPVSVNATRKINPAFIKAKREWIKCCDGYVYADGGVRVLGTIKGCYEATIILDESNRMDIDNAVKCLLDYAVRLELVADDSPKFLRRLVVEFGTAPRGCRLVLRSLE